MSAVAQAYLLNEVAVGQKDGTTFRVANNFSSKPAHNIGPIDEKGDFTESLGLVLGAENLSRFIQSLQSLVITRIYFRSQLQGKPVRDIRNNQRSLRGIIL